MTTETPKMGRPTKFTDETKERLERAFKAGMTDDGACLYAGIHRDTFYEWKHQYPDFSDTIQQWKSETIVNLRETLIELANIGDAKAIALVLEKIDPDWRYPPQPAQLTVTDVDSNSVNASSLPDEMKRLLKEKHPEVWTEWLEMMDDDEITESQ